MTYAIGDQVDDYVLTEQGWVPRLELDTSPFRPGHVVNDAILTETLEWRPLRTAPSAPYQIGDVVEGYVLVPSGGWQPLAGQLRDRSGALPATTAESTAKARPTASVRTTQTQTRPRAQAQPRPQTPARPQTQRPRVQPSSPQPQVSRPAQTQVQYRVGQVVDGHVLTPDRGWVPWSQAQRRPSPRPASTPTKNRSNDALGRALFGAIAVIVFILLRSCGG